jgi:hypothetical protein
MPGLGLLAASLQQLGLDKTDEQGPSNTIDGIGGEYLGHCWAMQHVADIGNEQLPSGWITIGFRPGPSMVHLLHTAALANSLRRRLWRRRRRWLLLHESDSICNTIMSSSRGHTDIVCCRCWECRHRHRCRRSVPGTQLQCHIAQHGFCPKEISRLGTR